MKSAWVYDIQQVINEMPSKLLVEEEIDIICILASTRLSLLLVHT